MNEKKREGAIIVSGVVGKERFHYWRLHPLTDIDPDYMFSQLKGLPLGDGMKRDRGMILKGNHFNYKEVSHGRC